MAQHMLLRLTEENPDGDETMTETTATTETPAVAAAEKETRNARAQKAVSQIATSEIAASPAEQPVEKTLGEPKKLATRTPRGKAVPAPVAPVDDIADLIKLEEENKQLRKELSDKLSSENADLRERLGKV